jgi:hypothetical protein
MQLIDSTKTVTTETVAEIYAIDALAPRREAIARAVARAIAVRTAGVLPPGKWTGVMAPRKNGTINFIPAPPVAIADQTMVFRAGANGDLTSRVIR